jgi:hypothetical protein
MTGHRCACDCYRAQARARSLDRAVGLWGLATLVGSCTLYAYVIPESWLGPWVWLPVLITWALVGFAPVWGYRWLVRWHAARSVAGGGARAHVL